MTENINQKDTQVTESTETTVSETGSGSASQTTERATGGRGDHFNTRKAKDAFDEFKAKLGSADHVFQFGGDASTGLGFCTVALETPKEV